MSEERFGSMLLRISASRFSCSIFYQEESIMLQRLFRLWVAFTLALGTSAPALADVLADVISKGTIRIGVPADLIPFGYQNANREPEGFDIDLANMVAKALGVKAELIP